MPEFTSDRMRLLGPLITPRALEIARHRLIFDSERVDKLDDDEATLRMALILLREMNPEMHLTCEEDGIRIGISRKKVGKMKAAGEI